MSNASLVAEALLADAQAELDINPDSRPAQVDYEGKLASWQELQVEHFDEGDE